MKIKKKIGVISVIMSALTYLYLLMFISLGTGEGVSLSTYGLWAVLAWISAVSMKERKIDPTIVIVGAVGTTVITIALVFKRRFGWTNMDSFVAILTVLCMVLWKTRGPKWSFIFSVLAGAIASIPFIFMTWHDPLKSPIIPNLCFLVTFILFFISIESKRLEERLIPLVNISVCASLVTPFIIRSIFG